MVVQMIEKVKNVHQFKLSQEVVHIIQVSLSEFIGTAMLVLLSCIGCMDSARPVTERAIAVGLSVTTIVQCLGHISGAHINPSVTLAAVVYGALPYSLAPYYFISQCLGALVGTIVLSEFTILYSTNFASYTCATIPHQDLSNSQAIMVEATVTSILVLLCCSCWDSRNSSNTDTNSIKFGLLVTVVKIIALSLTGACMNPATSLGPAFWNNYWDKHWIYWLGPLSGSLCTTLLYRLIFNIRITPEKDLPK